MNGYQQHPIKDAHGRNELSSDHFTPILRFHSHFTITDSDLVIGHCVYETTGTQRAKGSKRLNSISNRFKSCTHFLFCIASNPRQSR